MPPKRKRPAAITPKVLLQHMQAGLESVRMDLKADIRRLDGRIERLEKDIAELKNKDIAELQRNDEKTHAALQRLYEKRVETIAQLEDHEHRIVRLERGVMQAV